MVCQERLKKGRQGFNLREKYMRKIMNMNFILLDVTQKFYGGDGGMGGGGTYVGVCEVSFAV